MKKYMLLMLPVTVVLFTAGCKPKQAAEAKAPLYEMEKFFKNGDKTSFQISPDGNYFSYRADYNGKMNIFVQKAGATDAVMVTKDTVRSINRYFWKGDRIIYLQDIGGDENFQLFSVAPDGSGLKALTPFPGIRSEVADPLEYITGKENEMIVVINKRDKQYFDPYLINVVTGELKLLYENKENYENWITDNAGVIRMTTKTDGVNITYFYRDNGQEAFRMLLTTSFKESFSPQAFDAADKNLYVMTNIGRDKITLVEFDPVANKEVKELYSNPDYDLSYIFWDKQRKVLASVNWEGDRDTTHFFDEEWKALHSSLQEEFKDYEISISGWDDARKTGILSIYSDRLRVKYYLFDFATKKSVREISNPYPWLDEKDMAAMKPVTYKSRDGLTIHGYLTLPKGIEPKNLPVVINVHGGPWARDSWFCNPEVQFLANRGYAVFQINYRGSTGYGKEFWMASFKQWGKKMQDDLTDGVEYLKKEGIADPERVAIYGGSYGGYATLAGVAFTPDLYCCAVDYVGVSNLFTFMNTIPPYWKPYLDQFYEMVGDPVKDSVLLREASPVFHADKISTPLFIAQGANDPRVNKAESDQMVEALKARGVEVEYMVKDDEGHGFVNQENKFDFYGAMEAFFAKHLQPQQEKK